MSKCSPSWQELIKENAKEENFMSTLSKEHVKQLVRENNFQSVSDVNAYLKDIFKDIIQELLEAELEAKLGYAKDDIESKNTDNSRNGYTPKTIKSEFGEVDIQVPRDRKGEFKPKIIPKYQRDVSGIEEKVIALYAIGIAPEIKEWQQRPLEPIYSFIFMDAIHYKVRDNGRVVNRAAYVVLGVTIDGYKDILGIWIGENESSKFWLGVLNDLKNRGIQDVLIFCVDELTGLKEAINAAYPKAEVQRCIIHQLRNSFKYVPYKDLKAFSNDFKEVYHAINEEVALDKLYELKDKWGKEYPYAIRSWENNWEVISPFFKFTEEIRRIIYTTNIIEGLHRQFRKVTKSKSIFPTDSSLEKMLYLASMNVVKKWTQRYKNWDRVLSELMIQYEGRLESYI
jgi:transposase-like protein